MTRSLLEELRQTKPFGSPEEEAALNVARTAAVLADATEALLKPYGLSATQYNVLRILRGAEPDGLCRNELRDRMVTRMPDVTRLLDRMEAADLVSRSREGADRRMVSTRITPAGKSLVDSLDQPMADHATRLLGHLSHDQLHILSELLTELRGDD
jgi:DNA-binding MarR family transcriptional regulator